MLRWWALLALLLMPMLAGAELSTQAEKAFERMYVPGQSPNFHFPPLATDPDCTLDSAEGLVWYSTASLEAKTCTGGLAVSFGGGGSGSTSIATNIAALPEEPADGATYIIRDGLTDTDCEDGEGEFLHTCTWDAGGLTWVSGGRFGLQTSCDIGDTCGWTDLPAERPLITAPEGLTGTRKSVYGESGNIVEECEDGSGNPCAPPQFGLYPEQTQCEVYAVLDDPEALVGFECTTNSAGTDLTKTDRGLFADRPTTPYTYQKYTVVDCLDASCAAGGGAIGTVVQTQLWTGAAWVNTGAAAAGAVAGADTQVIYNDAGAYGGDAGLTFNETTNVLTVTGGVTGNASTATALAANGSNCAATEYAVGVSASGVAECTTIPVQACTVISDIKAADDDVDFGARWNFATTITGISCVYSGGTPSPTPTITLSDGDGNAMTITGTNPTCVAATAEPTVASVTAANALIANESMLIDVTNTPAPETTELAICVYGTRS